MLILPDLDDDNIQQLSQQDRTHASSPTMITLPEFDDDFIQQLSQQDRTHASSPTMITLPELDDDSIQQLSQQDRTHASSPTVIILPELDEKVFRQLRQHDLAQCARVNKAWHVAIIPHLWKSLYCLSSTVRQDKHAARMTFGRILLDDYLSEQQYRKVKEQGHSAEHIHHLRPDPPSPLAKYGAWIQVLPSLDVIRQLLKDTLEYRPLSTGFGGEPTSYELLSHLLTRAPAAHVQEPLYLELGRSHVDNSWEEVNVILPRVCHLHISGLSDIRILKDVLALCSGALRELGLRVRIVDSMETIGTDVEQADESMCWIALKRLRLWNCADMPHPTTFWPWLWRQCTHVESLDVISTSPGVLQSLTQCMLTDMPNLDYIRMGSDTAGGFKMTDSVVEGLIAGSRKGWRIVNGWGDVEFGKGAMRALERHHSTLEELSIEECSPGLSVEIVQTLSSCPRLRSLSTVNPYYRGNSCLFMDANVFADYDTSTGLFKTWACESTLRILKVRFTNIPRPDLGPRYVQETYPGQGRELQDQVYERLARLTNLEILQLGHCQPRDGMTTERADYGCLEMSLESGLGKLSKLKSLRDLCVTSLKTRIGVKEAQWMAEHWPRLDIIYGIEGNGDCREAAEWLREHCPTLRL